MTVYRKIKPSSESDSEKLIEEYVLMWVHNGGVKQWLFSSNLEDDEDSFTYTQVSVSDDFRTIPTEEENDRPFLSGSLSREEYFYVRSILKSPRIFIVGKDSVLTPMGLLDAKIKTPRIDKDYSISFTGRLKEPDLMTV